MNRLHQETREYLPRLRVGNGATTIDENPSYNLPRIRIPGVDPLVTAYFSHTFGTCLVYATNDKETPIIVATSHRLFPFDQKWVDEFRRVFSGLGYAMEDAGQHNVLTCGGQEIIHGLSINQGTQHVLSVGYNKNTGSPSHVFYAAHLDADTYHPELLNAVADFLDMPSAKLERVRKQEVSSESRNALNTADALLEQLEEPIKIV